MSPSRGIPTSRAYWELKAEQMLNRVFSGDTPIEVEIVEATTATPPQPSAHSPTEAAAAAPPPPPPARPSEPPARQRSAHALAALLQRRPEVVPISIAFAAISTAVGTVAIAGFWGQQQQALRQERNLVLLERLRAMGPGSTAGAITTATAPGLSDGLPPPPPDEPWMEELAQLPAAGAPPAEVLKVPFSSAITQQAPAATAGGSSRGTGAENLPQLVGVVQIAGRSGSAIFQVGGISTNATVGESIGNSGWRLRSASGDSAVIERGGQLRRISISSGF